MFFLVIMNYYNLKNTFLILYFMCVLKNEIDFNLDNIESLNVLCWRLISNQILRRHY